MVYIEVRTETGRDNASRLRSAHEMGYEDRCSAREVVPAYLGAARLP